MKYVVLWSLFFGLKSLYGQETATLYLSGHGYEDAVPWDFYCSAGMKSGQWTTIQVPSCWEQQGFGAYNYGHDEMERRLNETGTYRRRFRLPKQWTGQDISLVFEGVMTDALVKVNGKIAGQVHQGAFARFVYQVSHLLKPGKENELEVLVKKNSDNTSVNRAERIADFWVFGGIYRPVYLEAKPTNHIGSVAIDAKDDGTFVAEVSSINPVVGQRLKMQISSREGTDSLVLEQPAGQSKVLLSGRLANARPWTPESPHMYTATFSLLDRQGHIIHRYQQRFGFRTVEVRESDGIYVNGVRIQMKGVDRHTFHPLYGRTSSKALSIKAVNLIKDMNMNAVRMSHYPPDTHFLDVCDSLGLFVMDELTGWQKSYDDTAGRKILEEMIPRDVNHPSVILWSNGNEGGENDHLSPDFARLDIQKRKVVYPWQDYDLTNTAHYIDYNYLALDGFSQRKIFFPTEFLHGLYDGGLGAGLEDYWSRMGRDPLCAGGFLWVFQDEAIARTDRNGELDTDGNHAPDGILGPNLEKEGSFYAIKEIWSPLTFEKRYITPAFDGRFTIENRYYFTNLNQCKLEVFWIKLPAPWQDQTEQVVSTEELHSQLGPGQRGQLGVALKEGWAACDLLRIKATDPHGRVINTWTWPVKTATQKTAELLVGTTGEKPALTENEQAYTVRTGEAQISISKKDGTLMQVLKGPDTIPLAGGPFFVDKSRVAKTITTASEGQAPVIRATFENGDSFTWTFSGEGQLGLDVLYAPERSGLFAGISFTYPEGQVAGMRWLGNGPYRVYKNRMKGPQFGLWEKAYNNSVTGESGYAYPEFKGYHANVYWAEVQGKQQPGFRVYIKSNDVFLRMLTPVEPKDPANAKMVYPPGDISFLQAINSIGNKFSQTDALGPHSAPYTFDTKKLHERKLNLRMIFEF